VDNSLQTIGAMSIAKKMKAGGLYSAMVIFAPVYLVIRVFSWILFGLFELVHKKYRPERICDKCN
jgi:hypothetical protein